MELGIWIGLISFVIVLLFNILWASDDWEHYKGLYRLEWGWLGLFVITYNIIGVSFLIYFLYELFEYLN